MKYKKLILLMLCLFFDTTVCYAAAELSVSFTNPDTVGSKVPGEGSSGGVSSGPPTYTEDLGGGYTCKYQYSVSPYANISIDGFDQNDKSIIKKTITPQEAIKTGTSIGISIRETKSVTWSVSNVYVEKQEHCLVYSESSCSKNFLEAILSIFVPSAGESFACNESEKAAVRAECSGYSDYYRTDYINSGDKYNTCKQKADSAAKREADKYLGSSSYEVRLQNPNDGKKINVETEMVKLSASGGCGEPEIVKLSASGGVDETKISCTYEYLPESVCINKATATVRYSTSGGCGSDEFKIEHGLKDKIKHFHYFVPMNFDGEFFSLVLANKSYDERKEQKWCKDAVELNDNFADFLYVEGHDLKTATTKDEAYGMINSAGGCYVRSIVDIPVTDGFYRKDSSNKLKGFNFYFRTINENNPFPRPVANYSLWYEWYKKNYNDNGTYSAVNEMEPDIRNSFDTRSYLIKVNDVNAFGIRNYNDGKSYLNSLKDDGSGGSDFINGELSFNESSNDYYKVGCGPLNENEYLSDGTKKNPLYQEGC